MKTAYELTYKLSSNARKIYTAVQFHTDEQAALENGQQIIRRHDGGAIVIKVTPQPEVDTMIATGQM